MDKEKTDKKKILIVEDVVYNVELYKEVLEDAGFYVEYAYSGDDGLVIAEQTKFDLILLDLMLPTGTVNGNAFLQDIKGDPQKYGTPLVIIITNIASEVVIKDLYNEKADGYLIKTELTGDQLVSEVKNYLS